MVGLYANPGCARQSWDIEVGRGTIANTLREHGIDPAPERDATHAVVDVSQSALGMYDSDRLLYASRCCTLKGLMTLLRAVLYQPGEPHAWRSPASRLILNEALDDFRSLATSRMWTRAFSAARDI